MPLLEHVFQSSPPPLGLFGGTFDPVHYGHLRLAEAARETLGLAAVRWFPAGLPTHREKPGAASEHRLAMLRIALAGNPAFELDDSLAGDDTPAYTINILAETRRREMSARSLVWLMGTDAFVQFHTWLRWREIVEMCHIAVLTRRGGGEDETLWPEELQAFVRNRRTEDRADLAAASGGHVIFVDMPALDVSSSRIRALVAAGESARYLLPDAALDYIACHNLYFSTPHSSGSEC